MKVGDKIHNIISLHMTVVLYWISHWPTLSHAYYGNENKCLHNYWQTCVVYSYVDLNFHFLAIRQRFNCDSSWVAILVCLLMAHWWVGLTHLELVYFGRLVLPTTVCGHFSYLLTFFSPFSSGLPDSASGIIFCMIVQLINYSSSLAGDIRMLH